MTQLVMLYHDHFDAEHLAAVTAEMQRLGPPTLRAMYAGPYLCLLEGCHRARAAKALGLPIRVEVLPIPQDDVEIGELIGDEDVTGTVSELGDDWTGRVFYTEIELVEGE